MSGERKVRELFVPTFVLPCPFCGQTALYGHGVSTCTCTLLECCAAEAADAAHEVFNGVILTCESCGSEGPLMKQLGEENRSRLNAELAASAWNIRHPNPAYSSEYGVGCPFCGSNVIYQLGEEPTLGCWECGANGPSALEEAQGADKATETAIAKRFWRKRVAPLSLHEQIRWFRAGRR